ncbi:MAG TPA: pilus assembly PilX N-terminal domain-containing protein [Gammaproteobacteria bacterium]
MTMTMKNTYQQHGSVLVISLLILLVLTIIGVTALNSTVMEEKMASNFQTGHIAYQAAESSVNRTFATIATNYTLVNAAISADEEARANDDDPVWPTAGPHVMASGSPGANPDAISQTTLDATVSYAGPALGENCSVRLCGAEVVTVAGSGTVNNTNVTRTNILGVKKNLPQ